MSPTADKHIADAIRKKKIKQQLAPYIHEKYLRPKFGMSEEDETLNKLFQLVTQQVKQIVHKVHLNNEQFQHHIHTS